MRQAGNMAGLATLLEQAARLAPDNAHIQHDLGLTWLNLAKPANALPHLERAVALDPKFGHAHLRRGLALEALLQPGAAEAYQQAITKTPDLLEPYVRLASLRRWTGRLDEAKALYRDAARRTQDKQAASIYRAHAALAEHDLDAAEGFLRQVLAINSDEHEALGLLAYIQLARGDFVAAEDNLTKALKLRPTEVGLYFDLVHTRKIRADDSELIAKIRAAQSLDAPPRIRMRLHLALAKASDDVGDYEEAASQLEAASALQARYFPIDRKGLLTKVDRLIGQFTPDFLARTDHRRNPSERPILVLGMPRSGTTLTEQILSSHKLVAGGGEIHFWETIGQAFLRSARFGAVDSRRVAEAYLGRLQTISAEAERVVDKNPFNFMWAGLVHLMFPNALIVHCRRHPSDTCLSAMLANLAQQRMFSSAVDDLAFYYRQYQRVMTHYRSVLPADRFIEVDYEKLVEDPGTQIPSLIKLCGLPWDEACLTPERNNRTVLTASVWQARQPIYRSSSGRRRHYEALLRPFEALAQRG